MENQTEKEVRTLKCTARLLNERGDRWMIRVTHYDLGYSLCRLNSKLTVADRRLSECDPEEALGQGWSDVSPVPEQNQNTKLRNNGA